MSKPQTLDYQNNNEILSYLRFDIPAGLVLFLVSLPLCLGIALASGAPLFSGMISGVIGALLVSSISKSHLAITGPAASLAVIVLAAIQDLGYEAFLLSVVITGIFQIILGRIGAGMIGYYFPSAVISGLLTGIGIIIFLKQLPHAVGYDRDYEGDLTFIQTDHYTTFSELSHMLNFVSPGAVIISIVSLSILLLWESPFIKQRNFSQWFRGALLAVLVGTLLNQIFQKFYPELALGASHLVSLPVMNKLTDLPAFLAFPDFTQLTNPAVYITAITLAILASIQTLLSIEAIDKLDPFKRITPSNQELKAQGLGNILSGLIGGLPLTQVIIRSSVNIQAGAKTKMSAIVNGLMLLSTALLIPKFLNLIPLASLATILMVTGFRLANPGNFIAMYRTGYYHFVPFITTILGLLLTDMLIGISIGMAIALFFILLENSKIGFYLHQEHKANKTIITLSENVSFLNKANILQLLDSLPNNSEVVIDATDSKYIDYDVYEIIQNFKNEAARKNINIIVENLRGYGMLPPIPAALPPTQESQRSLTPEKVLQLLKEGNKRFMYNLKKQRNLLEQVNETVDGQFPFAIILSCIDSRTSAELIFDQGLGDIFSVRVAGNVVNDDILGSMEFACKLAGTKLIVVLGHSHCGAIKGACAGVQLDHLTGLLGKIQPALDSVNQGELARISEPQADLVEKVAEKNVEIMVEQIRHLSPVLRELEENGDIGIVGSMYDIETGRVTFYEETDFYYQQKYTNKPAIQN